jgi:hypothetical protein
VADDLTNPLLANLIQFESGGRNVTNTDATTSSGRARGFFQITDGTWNEFGGPATGYAKAQDAPYSTQWAIAQKIPLSRWDPKTLNYLRQQGVNYDPHQTLGWNAAQYGGGMPSVSTPNPAPSSPAAAQPPAAPASGPIDPSIIARGGVSPPIPAATPATPATPMGALASLGAFADQKNPQLNQGMNQLTQAFGGDQGDDTPRAQLIQPPGARNVTPFRGADIRQLYGTSLNSIAPMTSPLAAVAQPTGEAGQMPHWTPGPPGHNPWQNVGQQPIGNSLSSLNQWAMLSDPYMQQYYSGGLGGLV